jgi:cobyrinic acid a,c-diamide synthase
LSTSALHLPRLLIGGVASGVGKTTLVVGLIRALQARGLRVAPFKCGPDYLDPSYHSRAAGRPCASLDGWMMGRDAVLSTLARGARGCDIALIEGVMGLFDGASPTSDVGSAAEIARWTATPVVVAVDASGMARTIAAIDRGLAGFDPAVDVIGLIANRVGSAGHLDLLRRAADPGRVLGGLPKAPDIGFRSRHLGLHRASEHELPESSFDRWGELVGEYVDLERVLECARAAPELIAPPAEKPVRGLHRCRIGVAVDDAFHFYYQDNLRRLEALGAELVEFSPLADAELPEVDGLYLGGGYPELYAEALADNRALRRAIREFAAAGRPVYAECGGLMYLARQLHDLAGRSHEMTGVLDIEVTCRDRLQALGYVEVETQQPSILGGPGLRFRGHQFRYSEITRVGDRVDRIYSLRRRRDGQRSEEGLSWGNVLASYVHAHWASNPLVAEGLVRRCAEQAPSVARL